MVLRETGLDGVDRVYLALNVDSLLVLVIAVMNSEFHEMRQLLA